MKDIESEVRAMTAAIEKVMRQFNISTVHTVMRALNWKWQTPDRFTGKTINKVPSHDQITAKVRDMLTEAWLRKGSLSSGGFTAAYHENELTLSFIIEEAWSGDY